MVYEALTTFLLCETSLSLLFLYKKSSFLYSFLYIFSILILYFIFWQSKNIYRIQNLDFPLKLIILQITYWYTKTMCVSLLFNNCEYLDNGEVGNGYLPGELN